MKLFLFLAATVVSLTIAACSGTDRTNIDTDDPDKAFAIAMKSYEEKDYLQAIDDFSKALELDPNLTDAYVNRGFSYYNNMDKPNALKDWQTAVSQKPALDSSLKSYMEKAKK